jgi:hypothetical protein
MDKAAIVTLGFGSNIGIGVVEKAEEPLLVRPLLANGLGEPETFDSNVRVMALSTWNTPTREGLRFKAGDYAFSRVTDPGLLIECTAENGAKAKLYTLHAFEVQADVPEEQTDPMPMRTYAGTVGLTTYAPPESLMRPQDVETEIRQILRL